MSTRPNDGQSQGPCPPPCDRATSSREPIAVVGIGCRFPGGANDPEAFWRLLESGGNAVTEVPAERWNTEAFYDPDDSRPGKTYSRWGGFIAGIDRFDPSFFGISPREAARMDPQQRLLLEVAWEALEDGGLTLERIAGTRAAVFVGISSFDYAVLQTSFRDRGGIDVYSNTGGSLSIAANRISYCFDLRGPSAAVDTACSSALVAVHQACQSIWRESCPMALAGGVNALLLPDWYVGFCRMGMLSPEGRCRTFDSRADGFVRSEGAGVVVLKPLAQARADGDRVYAVIRGSAVNQDGRTAGMTVPSQAAQEALVREACRRAGVVPAQLQYVEAHGTGTPVGDPIEARALGRVVSEDRPVDQPCLVGSVKTNIGHLEAGAGIAGLIKTALALYHGRIPGNLHFERPNPEIDFDALRLRVPTRCEPWPTHLGPALAGVNAFGFGGTNAHVVLQEGGPDTDADAGRRNGASTNGEHLARSDGPRLIPLSARGPEALRAAAGALGDFLARCPEVPLHEIACTAALRRTHHDDRLSVVAGSRQELAGALKDVAAGRPAPLTAQGRVTRGRRPRIAFICSGQGPQWWAMGRELLRTEPVFRAVIERCDAVVRTLGAWSLREALTADEAASAMDRTAVAQPCLFALQVALAELWASWGVRPEVVVGHSVGEVAAAHLAGVLGLEDAVRVIFHRGRCMEQVPRGGRMLAAGIDPDEARRLVASQGDSVCLAALNGPASVTLAGDADPLEEIARQLEARGAFCRFLKVEYAFHSAQMDPIRDELRAALQGIAPRRSTLPMFSTVTGALVEGPELGPEYWWQNVRQTVRFADGVEGLIAQGVDTALELGPHPVLAAAVTGCFEARATPVTVLPSLRRQAGERATMLASLGALHVQGHPIDWNGVLPGPRRFVRLPLYAWQRERCWHEAEESRTSRLARPAHPLLGVAQGGPRPEWEARLDLRLTPYLADHRVQRGVILPATAYLELAFAVGQQAFGAEGCALREVKLANPCFLAADEPLRLHTVFDPGAATVEVHTRPPEGDHPWTGHLTAVLQPRPIDTDEALFSPEMVRPRCGRGFSRARCYEYLRMIGLDYGPMFQGIEEVWQGSRESLGLVRLPEALEGQAEAYLFHPALLDACLQVVIPADGDFDQRDGGLYLPIAVDQVQLLRRPGRRVWVHARLREKTPRQSVADLDVYDEKGRPVIRVRGLHSRRVAGGRAELIDDLLYAYQWQPRPLPLPLALAAETAAPGRWLIFADRGGVGLQLAERLRAEGDDCILTLADPGAGPYLIDATCPEDLERLVQSMTGPGQPRCRGVVHLGNLDAPEPNGLTTPALAAVRQAGLLSVVQLVQAWDRVGGDHVAPLFLVTRGAQAVEVEDRPEPLAVAQAPAIGLGRVISAEFSRLRCKLVDLDPHAEDHGVQALFEEVRSAVADDDGDGDGEDEVAWRGTERYVHRFLPAPGLPGNGSPRTGTPYRLALRQAGTLDGLVVQVLKRRSPGPGEVEIEVVAAGLNFSDVMKALGLYPGLKDGPVPLGAECSGRITAVGAGVSGLQPGDEVLAVAGFALGSHVLARAELVTLKPPRISFEEAAALPIAFLTAAYALEELARLGPGETVLIHAASGGVGLAAIQLARCAGARIFATAGTPEKRAYLQRLGIDTVLDSRSLAFADQVRERTGGRGVDVILNSLPGGAIAGGLDALADYGRFLEIGKRDIYDNTRIGLQPFRNNLSFFAIDLDRVIRERPAYLGTLLQKIVERVCAGALDPLPARTWPMSEAIEAFRFMQQGKHIGKLVLSVDAQPVAAVPAEDEPLTFRSDASYLITGGLGGFGLAVARWMAARGAGTLVLLGRRGTSTPEASAALAELEQLGARVVVRAGDVSRWDNVAAVLAEIVRTLPPLRGIVHAAMVLEDALLVNLNPDLVDRVLAPKVSGAWNLHLQTAGRPLDHFIMFSSLSSVFGHAGQGSYAAANAFLDALAWHRRACGLAALTVNWGYLGDTGYLARRSELGTRLERQGVLSISSAEALTALEKVLQRQHTQVSVMRLDWSRWRGLGVTGRIPPRLAHLCRGQEPGTVPTAQGTGTGTLPGRDVLRAAAAADRPALMESLLRDKLARVLGTSPERLDGDRPLLQLGLDSLMAVELRNWIEGELHINLPIVELMRSPSIARLAALLAEAFETAGAAPALALAPVSAPTTHRGSVPQQADAHGLAPPALDTAPEVLLERVKDLSGEEIDTLLTTLLQGSSNNARR